MTDPLIELWKRSTRAGSAGPAPGSPTKTVHLGHFAITLPKRTQHVSTFSEGTRHTLTYLADGTSVIFLAVDGAAATGLDDARESLFDHVVLNHPEAKLAESRARVSLATGLLSEAPSDPTMSDKTAIAVLQTTATNVGTKSLVCLRAKVGPDVLACAILVDVQDGPAVQRGASLHAMVYAAAVGDAGARLFGRPVLTVAAPKAEPLPPWPSTDGELHAFYETWSARGSKLGIEPHDVGPLRLEPPIGAFRSPKTVRYDVQTRFTCAVPRGRGTLVVVENAGASAKLLRDTLRVELFQTLGGSRTDLKSPHFERESFEGGVSLRETRTLLFSGGVVGDMVIAGAFDLEFADPVLVLYATTVLQGLLRSTIERAAHPRDESQQPP